MEKSTFLTPRGDRKCPKIAPRRPQDGLEDVFFRCRNLSSILIRFGSHFGAILAPFWLPFGSLLGPFGEPKSDQIRPRIFRSPPRGPKRRPRGPKRRPKGTQEPPKRHPQAAKRTKKGAKSTQKAAKSTKRGTQEHPNGKKCFKAFKYVARFPFLLGKVYVGCLFFTFFALKN